VIGVILVLQTELRGWFTGTFGSDNSPGQALDEFLGGTTWPGRLSRKTAERLIGVNYSYR
jgi:hypothetical protein